MKTNYWDVVFMVFLAGILLVLGALGWLDTVLKFPFEITLISYFAGRYVSLFLQKRKSQSALS
jgi:hypothetical protein